MIYRDNLLGADYAGNVFVCEPVHNLVHRELIRPAGVTFTSRRAPEEATSEVFASADNWSRFTSVRAGPDGALYTVDMYRLVIEHPQWIPDEWLKELGDLRAGEDKGRIYRIYPRDAKLRSVPRLDRADDAELVEALESPSGLIRDLAQQQLAWRGKPSAKEDLEERVTRSARPETRVQALCSLDLMGILTEPKVAAALRDSHPGVRRQAVRLTEQFAGEHPELLYLLCELVDDPDPGVRQQVAYTLGEWKYPTAGIALGKLVRKEKDPFIVAAAMSSAPPHADSLIAHLDPAEGVDNVLIDIATATGNARVFARLLSIMTAPRAPQYPMEQFTAVARFLDGLNRNGSSLARLRAEGDAALSQSLARVDEVIAAARRIAAADSAAIDRRVAAVALLGRTPDRPDEMPILAGLLEARSPVELQLAAVKAMGKSSDPTVAERLLSGWSGYGPEVRRSVLGTLVLRPRWVNILLNRLETDRDMLGQIDTAHRAQLSGHNNAAIAARARRILTSTINSDRQKVIDLYAAGTKGLTGDPQRGNEVFARVCAACHKFGQVSGGAIGPDIASLNDRSGTYLLEHILDPNRAIEGRYVLYIATTNDNRTLSGMVKGEAGNSITLVGLDGVEQVILRSELSSLTSTGRSLMPDGLEAAIDHQAMADLIAFIAGSGGQISP